MQTVPSHTSRGLQLSRPAKCELLQLLPPGTPPLQHTNCAAFVQLTHLTMFAMIKALVSLSPLLGMPGAPHACGLVSRNGRGGEVSRRVKGTHHTVKR